MSNYKVVKVKLNVGAVREQLLQGAGAGACAEIAREIAGRCGQGYETDVYTGKNRANASVYAATAAADADNAANNTLLKAMG